MLGLKLNHVSKRSPSSLRQSRFARNQFDTIKHHRSKIDTRKISHGNPYTRNTPSTSQNLYMQRKNKYLQIELRKNAAIPNLDYLCIHTRMLDNNQLVFLYWDAKIWISDHEKINRPYQFSCYDTTKGTKGNKCDAIKMDLINIPPFRTRTICSRMWLVRVHITNGYPS